MALPVPVREDESPSLQVLGASSLALWMQDLDSDQGSEFKVSKSSRYYLKIIPFNVL